MEITRQKSGDLLVLRLAGRLDANWCNHVQNALSAAVRDGEHRIHLDMAQVAYVSSAGLRVLLTTYKQLRAINGLFGVARASPAVREVLELAGLEMLIAADPAPEAVAEPPGGAHTSPSATYEVFPVPGGTTPFLLEAVGHPGLLTRGIGASHPARRDFGGASFALGIGALGASYLDCEPRFGEMLAVAGTAAFQPADGSSRPDFVVSQGALVPEGYLPLGLAGTGDFATLARFSATKEARTIGLTELAQTALGLAATPAVAFVVLAETAGLVGATLRQSPAPTATGPARLGFPQIRDWLSFTSERAHRDSTALLVGVAALPGTTLDPLLRPLGSPALRAHIHAAVFPYRPLRQGRLDLKHAVSELFDGHTLQAVLHLLADKREFNGAGDSEFLRGALWLAPLRP
jgi:anti-anti-sigma factor